MDGVPQPGGLSTGSSVLSTKIAICSRVTDAVGQYRLGPQPETTPRLASSSMKRQKGLVSGTSMKTFGGEQAGGVYPEPSFESSTNTAICSRVVALPGQ